MAREHAALRFADQDDRTLSLLAQVQRETGYVPTMDELCQLLQCSTIMAARQRLEELVTADDGARLTPAERRELDTIAERVRREHGHCPRQQRSGDRRPRTTGRAQVRWARPSR